MFEMQDEMYFEYDYLVEYEDELPFFRLQPASDRKDAWNQLQEGMAEVFMEDAAELKKPEQTEAEYVLEFFDTWLEDISYADLEKFLVEYLSEEVQDEYQRNLGRDPQELKERAAKERVRRDELEIAYELQSEARAQGKRFTRRDGFCYVCGGYIDPQHGELLLSSEIPEKFHTLDKSGKLNKWYVRCFSSPCSDAENGGRDKSKHIEVNDPTPNRVGERCWTCGVFVHVGEGIIVHRDLLPEWIGPVSAPIWSPERTYFIQCKSNPV